MKSIVAEASSISKAIEKALSDAGNPKEFSVKILENPLKNFLGFTTRSAKIALIFQEPKVIKQVKPNNKKPKPQPIKKEFSNPKTQTVPLDTNQNKKTMPPKDNKNIIEKATRPLQPIWTEPMIQKVTEWVKETLKSINKDNKFTVTPNNYYLKIKFDTPVYEEQHRQKQLFASLATLMLSMLKRQYKRPLRGYKIILTTDKDA